DSASDEPVQPAIPELTIDAREAWIRKCSASTASPVVPRLGVHVIAEVGVVADVLDVTPVGGAVAYELAESEARREDAAAPAVSHVLEKKRKPEDRDAANIQSRGTCNEQVLRDELDLAGF